VHGFVAKLRVISLPRAAATLAHGNGSRSGESVRRRRTQGQREFRHGSVREMEDGRAAAAVRVCGGDRMIGWPPGSRNVA
jgi:hypothetical protein